MKSLKVRKVVDRYEDTTSFKVLWHKMYCMLVQERHSKRCNISCLFKVKYLISHGCCLLLCSARVRVGGRPNTSGSWLFLEPKASPVFGMWYMYIGLAIMAENVKNPNVPEIRIPMAGWTNIGISG